MAETKAVYYGTGRRKTSVARVRLVPGTGQMTVNKKTGLEFFGRQALVNFAETPFKATVSPVPCSRRATSTVASSSAPATCVATPAWSSARSTD
jgi:ribosomal protein S9